ncbi:hypothetical protein GALL_532420 [mine drainage metagenome]|uniref:Uncharacterized protein n=1 Tax=mine drainage metagenome TaxID=410659 RepID=A0A1J5P0Z0_9ZZZZ
MRRAARCFRSHYPPPAAAIGRQQRVACRLPTSPCTSCCRRSMAACSPVSSASSHRASVTPICNFRALPTAPMRTESRLPWRASRRGIALPPPQRPRVIWPSFCRHTPVARIRWPMRWDWTRSPRPRCFCPIWPQRVTPPPRRKTLPPICKPRHKAGRLRITAQHW